MTGPRRNSWRRAGEGARLTLYNALRQRLIVERIDAAGAVFVAAVLGAILVFGAAGAFAYVFFIKDKSMTRPVEDARLLRSFRDGVKARPFLDGAYSVASHELYISQKGGVVHRYDPDARLWSEERPQSGLKNLSRDFTSLRAGCGTDAFAAADGCADEEIVWGRTDSGALAFRRSGRWRALFNETRWVDKKGAPVEARDLTAAAAGASGGAELLVLFSKNHDMGVYDVNRRTWLETPPEIRRALPRKPTRVRHAGDRFWIGGGDGLGYLSLQEGRLAAGKVDLSGEVLDIQPVGATSQILALLRTACSGEGEGCLRLARLDSPGGAAKFLIDEKNVYNELSAGRMHFADVHGRWLIVAGGAGVYRYDSRLHSWDRLDGGAVSAVLNLRPGREFAYGRPGGADAIVDGERRGAGGAPYWSIRNQTAVKIERNPGAPEGSLIALTARRLLAALDPGGGEAVILHDDAPSAADPRGMLRAVGYGDNVLMTGGKEALVHDAARRRYVRLDPNRIDPGYFKRGTQLAATEKQVFAVERSGRGTHLTAYDWDELKKRNPHLSGYGLLDIQGRLRALRRWDADNLSAMDADGRPRRLGFAARRGRLGMGATGAPLIGEAIPDLDQRRVRDVAVTDQGGLIFATDRGFRIYNPDRRSWSEAEGLELDGGDFRDLTLARGDLIARTGFNRLARFSMGDPSLPRARMDLEEREGKRLIGGELKTSLADGDITDAYAAGAKLYLGGKGRAAVYDMDARAFRAEWMLGMQTGKVRFAGVAAGRPVSLAGGQAWWGEHPLNPGEGLVRTASLGPRHIWTVRVSSGVSFLMAHPRNDPLGPPTCYFRNPFSGARKFIDAKRLGDGRVLALTESGLSLYDERRRSWFTGPRLRDLKASLGRNFTAAAGDRLHLLAGHIVLHMSRDEGEFLGIAPVGAIPAPDSCSRAPVSFNLNLMRVVSASVNEKTGEIAWLDRRGEAFHWRAGATASILASPADAPEGGELFRLFPDGDRLHFASADGIWTYDKSNHGWRRAALLAPDGQPVKGVRDLDVEGGGQRKTVTAWTASGETLAGEWSGQGDARLERVADAPLRFDRPGADILDVIRDRPGRWIFVLPDRLKILDADKRSWLGDVRFPTPDRTRRLKVINGVFIVTEASGGTWWIARSAAPDFPSAGLTEAPELFWRYDGFGQGERLFVGRRSASRKSGAEGKDVPASGVALLLLRADGSVHECSLSPRAPEPHCLERYGAAPLMTADAIEGAYRWGRDAYVFFERNSVRVYDRASRREGRFPKPGAARPVEARETGGAFWTLFDDGAIARLVPDTAPVFFQTGAESLPVDRDGRVWAASGNSLFRWTGKDFAPFSRSFSLRPGEKLAVAALQEGGVAAAATSQGRILYFDGKARELFAGLNLPSEFRLGSMDRVLLSQDGRGVWIQQKDRLSKLELRGCGNRDGDGGGLDERREGVSPWSGQICRVESVRRLILRPKEDLWDNIAGKVRTWLVGARRVAGLVEKDDGSVQAWFDDSSGRLVFPAPSGEGAAQGPSLLNSPAPASRGLVNDARKELSAFIRPRNDGRSAFDPVYEIGGASAGTDVVFATLRSSSGRLQPLNPIRGSRVPADPPALDAGWLSWRREASRFRLRTADGRHVDLRGEELAPAGEFIFAAPGGRAAGAPGSLPGRTAVVLANRYGVWRFSDRRLRLDDLDVTYVPADLRGEIRAAHGGFCADGKAIDFSGARRSSRFFQFSLGQVEFKEDLCQEGARRPGLTGLLPSAAGPINVLSGRGFPWDRRQAVAWSGPRLFAQTGAGVHAAAEFSGFQPLPSGRERSAARIKGDGSPDLYLRQGAAWFKLGAAGWDATNDPFAAYSAAAPGQALSGRRRDPASGAVKIVAGSGGLGFARDLLVSAAYGPAGLAVATQDGLELAQSKEAFEEGASKRVPAPPGLSELETMAREPGRETVYARVKGGLLRLDGATGSFQAVEKKDDPSLERTVFDREPVKVVWRKGQPDRVEKLIRVWRPDLLARTPRPVQGRGSFERFGLIDGVFAFDAVQGVEWAGGRLYVAAAMGVQLYDDPANASLFAMRSMVDVRPHGRGAYDRIGTPYGQSGAVAARSGSVCALFDGSGVRRCDPEILDKTAKGASRFFEFWRDEANRPRGGYRLAGGGLTPGAERIVDGRLDHDRIADFIACNGRLVTAWRRGWLTVHDGNSLALSRASGVYAFDGAAFNSLYCLDADLESPRVRLKAGVYAADLSKDPPRGVVRFDGRKWTPVADAGEARTMAALMRGEIVYQRGRLRLRRTGAEGARFVFEYGRLDGRWTPLNWRGDNRLGVDEIHNFIFVKDRLWALTPAGFVPYELGRSGLRLNPDHLNLIDLPKTGATPCTDADLKASGAGTLARCAGRSDLLFAGRLGLTRDGDVFQHRPDLTDPFAGQELVSAGAHPFWSVRRKDVVGLNNPGRLEIGFRGEDAALDGGRFNFDTLHSVSGLFPGSIELASTEGGWWRIPLKSAGLKGMTRPPLPGGEVIARSLEMRRAMLPEGSNGVELAVCVLTASNQAVLLSRSYQVQRSDRCEEYLGKDFLWRYVRGEKGLVIRGGSRVIASAPVTRSLIGGRFSDDMAAGMPVSLRKKGEVHYLVPTRAGVLDVDLNSRPWKMRSLAVQANARGDPASVLYVSGGGEAYYFDGRQLRLLSDNARAIAQRLTAPGVVHAIEEGPAGALRLRWKNDETRGWSIIPPAAEGRSPDCRAVAWNARDRRLAYPDVYWTKRTGRSSEISVFFYDKGVFVVDENGNFAVRDLGRRPDPIAYVVHRDRIFFLERDELFEVNMDFAALAVQAFRPRMGEWRFAPDGPQARGFGRLTLPRGTPVHRAPDLSSPAQSAPQGAEATVLDLSCEQNWRRVWVAGLQGFVRKADLFERPFASMRKRP